MQKIEREVAPNQVGFDYPTMTEEELEAFPVADLAANDCHLFLWTTHKFLPMAFRLVEHWGFTYICTMVWHKAGGFQPFGLPQYNCEFVLFCRKGNLPFLDTKDFPCCFTGARREHSRKPDEFYRTIARVSPGPRLDVFSREARDGFAQYGKETELYDAALGD
jgi:N6-adenosine-specific RNA methylase IME4